MESTGSCTGRTDRFDCRRDAECREAAALLAILAREGDGGYVEGPFDERLAGIPLRAWQKFFSPFTENRTDGDMMRGLDSFANRFATAIPAAEG